MFLEVSLPANIVQFPDLQKNGNGAFFTQGSSVFGSAEKKDQISEKDQSLPARPLVWIYSPSFHPCPSCLFSTSDSLFSHYTTHFHRSHSLSLDSLHFVPNISFFLPLSFLHSSLQHGLSPAGMACPPQVASLCGAAMGASSYTIPSGCCQMQPRCFIAATAMGSNARGNSAQKNARFPPTLSLASSHPGQGLGGPGVMSSSPMCPHHLCRSLQVLAVGRPACCGRCHPGSTYAFLWATPCIALSCNCCDWNVISKPHLCGPGDDSAGGHWVPSPWAAPQVWLHGAREAMYRPFRHHQLCYSLSCDFQFLWEMPGSVFALREIPALLSGPQFYHAYSKRN